MTSPRIVICTAAVGCGHTRAALALRQALRHAVPGCVVQVIEALDFAPQWFVRSYRDGYLAAIARVPKLAGWLYDISDHPPGGPMAASCFERLALRDFAAHPSIQSADLVVTTHFLCARILSDMRHRRESKQGLRAPLAVCVTDQHPHGIWLVPHADRILVASQAARDAAIAAGVPPLRIAVTGIPIDAQFGSFSDATTARLEMGLPRDRPVVLVCGGGLGLGGVEHAVRALLSVGGNFHVVAVCGRNAELFARIQGLHRDPDAGSPSCQVLGFSRRMPELMGAADLLVGKPGGLTTSEAMASALPMVLLRPLPGQEERNANRLVASGAAVLHNNPTRAGEAAANLLRDPEILAQMRRSARTAGTASSAENAAAAVLDLIGIQIPLESQRTDQPVAAFVDSLELVSP